jgi:hypothetical protein
VLTPDGVIQELMSIRAQSEKGVALLAEAETKHMKLALEADRIEAQALLDASGTVVDRQSLAKLASLEAREQAELAKIEMSRIKNRIKLLQESMMAVMSAAKMVEITYKTAGIGER